MFVNRFLVATVVAFAMTAQPLAAKERRHSGDDGSDVAALLGGLILGAVVANELDRNDRRRYRSRDYDYDYDYSYDDYGDSRYSRDRYTMPRRARYYEHYCVTEQRGSRSGRIYFRRTCQ